MVAPDRHQSESKARGNGRLHWKVSYAYLVIGVAVLVLLAGYWEYQGLSFRDKAGTSVPPLDGALTLGPIFTGSDATTYNLTVVSSAAIKLIDLAFEASTEIGGMATILTVCVSTEEGTAIGTWNGSAGTGWASRTTTSGLVCSNGTSPRQEQAPGNETLSSLDELYFYLASPLNAGSDLAVIANGLQFQGSVVQNFSGYD
jgi:hypothetical protein